MNHKDKDPRIWVKKLALAYQTGWEYIPDSDEAGSVFADIFLNMMEDNRRHFNKIWENHRREIMSLVPPQESDARIMETALSVKAMGESHGQWIDRGTEVYTVTEEGEIIRFAVTLPVQLTSAKLNYVIQRKGLSAWLDDEVILHPVFKWRFRNLCNGREKVSFGIEFEKDGQNRAQDGSLPPGNWSVSDGENTYMLGFSRKEFLNGELTLDGDTPGFMSNLDEILYELCLDIPAGEKLTDQWAKILCGEIALNEEGEARESRLCINDEGVCGGERLLPFTADLDVASCCYFACDSVFAVADRNITMEFSERYEIEEKLPPGISEEYEKVYRKVCKKYPWLNAAETVQEWKIAETVWEYFDGNFWRVIPESRDWKTGNVREEAAERCYQWARPQDMQACVVEGEEHFYIRIRLEKTDNAYTPYYRKYIPVFENIIFKTPGRKIKPYEQLAPDISEIDSEKVYLGFDSDVTSHNCWYTGGEIISFKEDWIKGRKHYFGKDAYWVEAEGVNAEVFSQFWPNYIQIRQIREDKKQDYVRKGSLSFPTGCEFSIETDNMGVLDAVSVCDAVYAGDGVVMREERQWQNNYFTEYGRVISISDIDVLLEAEYPMLKAVSYDYDDSGKKITFVLEPAKGCDLDNVKKRLPEVRGWMKNAVHKLGGIWMESCRIECVIR